MNLEEYKEEAEAARIHKADVARRLGEMRSRVRDLEADLARADTQKLHAEFDYSCAKNGDIPLKDGSWVMAASLGSHPDLLEKLKADGRLADGWEDLWQS